MLSNRKLDLGPELQRTVSEDLLSLSTCYSGTNSSEVKSHDSVRASFNADVNQQAMDLNLGA